MTGSRLHRFSPLGQAALAYAGHYNWRLFPLRPKSKEPPLITGWSEKAATDPAQLGEWWTHWPQANIALATGLASGVVVVDVDPRNGGQTTWTELQDIHGRIDTLEAQSGSGGSHFFFAPPHYPSLHKGKLGPGVDLQGEGAYVVLSPSVHPCGQPYEWVTTGLPPAPLPLWLLNEWPKAERSTKAGQVSGVFTPHKGLPLPTNIVATLTAFLLSARLVLQRDGRYRGPCPFPHQVSGDCECPASFYCSPVTGTWTCFCSDHPGAGRRGLVSGGSGAILALAGIAYSRSPTKRTSPSQREHRRIPDLEIIV